MVIIKELGCSKCEKITFHEEISPDLWRCRECNRKRILHARIQKRDLQSIEGYLYRDGDLFYFEDIVGECIIKAEDIKKLEDGEFRIPIYRISKFDVKII